MRAQSMGKPQGDHMDAGNTFAVLTAFAFLAVLPVALILEGTKMQEEWQKALASVRTRVRSDEMHACRCACTRSACVCTDCTAA